MSGAITPDRQRVRRTYRMPKKRHETCVLPSAADCNADTKVQIPYFYSSHASGSKHLSNCATLKFQALLNGCAQQSTIRYNDPMHWLTRYRLLILGAICAVWTGLILLGHFFSAAPFVSVPWRGAQSFEDLLRRAGRKTAPPNDFVFLGIDQRILELPPIS